MSDPYSNWGSCCSDLREALGHGADSAFQVSDSILYLAVGHAAISGGPDQPVLFCPFCGSKLQSQNSFPRQSGAS